MRRQAAHALEAETRHSSGFAVLPRCTAYSPYGIRTRAAAVRGRCPRPLDEWAVRRGSVPNVAAIALAERGRTAYGAATGPLSPSRPSSRASRPRRISSPVVSKASYRTRRGGSFTIRTVSSRSPWQRAYAAASSSGFRRSLFRRGQVMTRHLARAGLRGNPAGPPGSALCRRNLRYRYVQGLQDQGLQSRPEATKYRCAAFACARAVGPCPKMRRSFEPI